MIHHRRHAADPVGGGQFRLVGSILGEHRWANLGERRSLTQEYIFLDFPGGAQLALDGAYRRLEEKLWQFGDQKLATCDILHTGAAKTEIPS